MMMCYYYEGCQSYDFDHCCSYSEIQFFLLYILIVCDSTRFNIWFSLRCHLFVLPGFTITVALNESQLAITVAAPDNFLNDTKGLLGVFNKDPSDDLTPADGSEPLATNATEKTIFYKFGETCKLPWFN